MGIAQPGIHDRTGGAATLALPWCGILPDSPRGTAIDHIIPRVYGGPHRRWNLQLLHQECNSAKGKELTAEALELADAHGVTISMDIGQYRAGSGAGRPSMPCGRLASSAARPATGLWPRRGISPCSSQREGFMPSSGQRRKGPGPLTGSASSTGAAGVTGPGDLRVPHARFAVRGCGSVILEQLRGSLPGRCWPGRWSLRRVTGRHQRRRRRRCRWRAGRDCRGRGRVSWWSGDQRGRRLPVHLVVRPRRPARR